MEAKQYGSIHLNFALLLAPNTSVMKVAHTLIHEASHKFLDTVNIVVRVSAKVRADDAAGGVS